MKRVVAAERPDLLEKARRYGFDFHTMYGEKYWDESAYYQFSLKQIEDDIEDPTAELHQMCLEVVDKVCGSEELMERFLIPQTHRDWIRESWLQRQPSLYSRLDLAYNGRGPAKLLENNADTPTSLYETGFWQWLWLEDSEPFRKAGADQFNSLQDKLITRFHQLAAGRPGEVLYFSCVMDNVEDRGTVQYLQDCADEAGLNTAFCFLEDIGIDDQGRFTANPVGEALPESSPVIDWIFKLYPWEEMVREDFGRYLMDSPASWLEPPWKTVLSNKALLPMLWQMFPGHPNLLEAHFADRQPDSVRGWVRKPFYSREGANITVLSPEGETLACSDGEYGEQPYIYQAFHALPEFDGNYTLIGSWLVDDQPAGMSVREDSGLITRDMSRYLPHIIL